MRIIYFCSIKNKAYGGLDVIFRHAEILKSLGADIKIYNTKNVSILKKIFYFNPPRYKSSTINLIHNIKSINKDDFVILPEILVSKYASYLNKKNINYIILVQGPFLIKSEDIIYYYNACLVLGTSNLIIKYLRKLFPSKNFPPLKYIRLSSPVVTKSLKKQNIITYMPRKMTTHSKFFIEQMSKTIPNNWKIIALDNLDHKEVCNILNKSSIFLNFTDLEGFGLPALEAGIYKNIVIGYTGLGSDEFFSKPIYNKIDHGNLIKFKDKLLHILELVDQKRIDYKAVSLQQKRLALYYSKKNEIDHLKQLYNFLRKIKSQ